jgi:transcriptional antiterminator RfaH
MPILPVENDKYPPELFAGYSTAADEAAHIWWVLHTRPRQEKCLARELLKASVPFYLPQVARRTRTRGRLHTSHVPLFTSYLFLLGSDSDRLRALGTNRVAQALRVVNQQQFWQQLTQLNRLIESKAPVTAEDRLQPGDLVEICSGSLTGMRGTVIRSEAGRRFVLRVDFIERGASVELDENTIVRACT